MAKRKVKRLAVLEAVEAGDVARLREVVAAGAPAAPSAVRATRRITGRAPGSIMPAIISTHMRKISAP